MPNTDLIKKAAMMPADRIAPASQGTYALYELPDGGLHLAYRAAGAGADEHIDVPAFVVKMARNMADGKGPLPGPFGSMVGRIATKQSRKPPAKQNTD